MKGADILPEPVQQVKGKKTLSKKSRKAQEEEQRRAQQRRSVSDLGVHKTEQGSLMAREARAQALAKKSATLRTIQETGPSTNDLPPPPARRQSAEYNGRPSIMLGADVSRAMKWAEGNYEYREDKDDRRKIEVPKPAPVEKPIEKPKTLTVPTPKPAPAPVVVPPKPSTPPPKLEFQPVVKIELPAPKKSGIPVAKRGEPENDVVQEIPREPKVLPKVNVPRSKSPEPRAKSPEPRVNRPEPPASKGPGPILLAPDPKPTYLKPTEKDKAQSSKFKKLFGSSKSKEEKDTKRVSRAMSPMPPSPTTAKAQAIQYLSSTKPTVSEPKVVTPARSPSPVLPVTPSVKEWEEDFDGTHRKDSLSTQPSQPPETFKSAPIPAPATPVVIEEYVPATPPTIPIVRSETPSRDRSSDDESLDRWAQIRKNAGQRALTRPAATARNGSSDEIIEVNVPRVRQVSLGDSPKRKVLKPDEEDEESVDARVARIRKRVQELTAGMGDDDD